MGKQDAGNRIQVLERSAQILELFTPERTALRFSDIVSATSLNKSTAFNIVDTLRQLGFLEQDEESRKYYLGRQFLRYGEIAKRSMEIVKLAEPYMIQLRDEVNETVQLAKLSGSNTVYLHKAASLQSVQTFSMTGATNPAYATGLGKAMLAYRDDRYVDDHFPADFPQLTQHTLRDTAALKRQLQDVRQNGIAFDREEYSLGLMCIACPIFDHNGTAAYAISVSAPTYRITPKMEQQICARLKEAAASISHQLGYDK